MPLSEHEQRLLEQMERALYAEDPKLASTLMRGHHVMGVTNRRNVFLGLLLAIGGLAAVIGGVAANVVFLGVAGFAAVVGGLVLVVRALRAPATDVTATPPQGGATPQGTSGFMGKMEDRWNRRQEGTTPNED